MKEQTFQEYCDRVRKLEKRVKALEQETNIITLTQKEYSDLCIQLKGLGWKFVQEQELNRDMEEIEEIMKSDTDAETKRKMISNILTAKPHYFAEQEPCEDAVRRQAVKELYCRICMETNICYRSKENCEDLKLFDELPSAQPKPKTGRWITKRTIIHDGEPYCDQCDVSAPHEEISKFCPNCGADMRGDTDADSN